MRSRWLALAVLVPLLIILFIVCCLTDICCPVAGVTTPESQRSAILTTLGPPAAAQAAAEKGLKTLSQLGGDSDKTAMSLGFSSAREKKAAQLGDPLPMFAVDLMKLKDFQKKPKDLAELANLVTANLFIYPVTVAGEVRSSLTVKQLRTDDRETWKAVEFGDAVYIRLLDQYKKTSNANVVVLFPGLHRRFLGRLTKEDFLLIPILDDPRLALRPGQAVPAEKVFEKLQVEAKIAVERGQKRQPGQKGQQKQGGGK